MVYTSGFNLRFAKDNLGIPKNKEQKVLYQNVFINSFSININKIDSELSLIMKEELIELSDENLCIKCNEILHNKFWISIRSDCPQLLKVPLLTLLPFATTYTCEIAFSTLMAIKKTNIGQN